MLRIVNVPSTRPLRSSACRVNQPLTATIRFFSVSGKFPKKPVILLDIDGVVNLSFHDNPSKIWKDNLSVKVKDYNIIFSPELVGKINEWSKIADIRWLTTWDNHAITFLAPALKLEEFKLAEGRYDYKKDEEVRKRLWKYFPDQYKNEEKIEAAKHTYLSKKDSAMATAAEVGSDGLVIWIDDELKKWTETAEKDKEAGNEVDSIYCRPNTVLLSPCCGLTKEHVAFIDNVLADPEVTKDKCVKEFEEGLRCVIC